MGRRTRGGAVVEFDADENSVMLLWVAMWALPSLNTRGDFNGMKDGQCVFEKWRIMTEEYRISQMSVVQ